MLNWLKRLFTRKPKLTEADMRAKLAEVYQRRMAEVAASSGLSGLYRGTLSDLLVGAGAPTQDSQGRWRDARGRFARDPYVVPEWSWKAVSTGATVGASPVDQTPNAAN